MHIQAKATPAASPPDLEAFVKVLSEPETPPGQPQRVPINIEGVSGEGLETGGQITFSFDHDREADVAAWLEEAGYRDVEFMHLDDGDFFQAVLLDEPGQLLAAIRDATAQNLSQGRIIKNLVIGLETQADKRSYVNITFQEVKTG